jgi:hypothetical protein
MGGTLPIEFQYCANIQKTHRILLRETLTDRQRQLSTKGDCLARKSGTTGENMKGIKAILSAAVILASLGTVQAQLTELESTKSGTGTLSYRTRSSSAQVRQVRVNLRRNGNAEIRVVGGDTETFTGTWRNDGRSRTVRINIDRMGRDRADGTGTILLDGRGSFTDVDLTGRSDGAAFRLNFDTSGSSGGDWGEAMRATRNGWGTLRYRTRSSNNQINRLSVDLKRDGGFEIRILSGDNETFRGRWRSDRSNRVHLDIDRVGNDRATGEGYIDLNRKDSFNRVNLTGREDGSSFSLDFRATTSDRDDDDDYNWKKFRDAAQREIRSKFPGRADFTFNDESISDPTIGNRTVRGRFEVKDAGNRNGRYEYTVLLGAGTARVISSSHRRL